jgi:transposase-like protein
MLRCVDKGNQSHGEYFMSTKRRNHTPQFKFRVALEAAQNHKTVSQIASSHNVHTTLVNTWRKQLKEKGPAIFLTASARSATARKEQERVQRETELYEQIGRLNMELEWLKKKSAQFD